MNTSCIAFFNKLGIVAVSDSDFSIRPLSKNFPAAIVVNTYSPIPWKKIIDEYLLENDSKSFSTLEDCFASFSDFFKSQKIAESLIYRYHGESVMILGYSDSNLYPTLIKSEMEYEDRNNLVFADYDMRTVSYRDPAFYAIIGNLNFVSSILTGASDSFMQSVVKNEMQLLSLYRNSLNSEMDIEDSNIEKNITSDLKETIEKQLISAGDERRDEITHGLSTLSISEIVDYAETLVNAEVRLRNLRHREGRGTYGTREIAVITIPEGLTWIKHHLFAI